MVLSVLVFVILLVPACISLETVQGRKLYNGFQMLRTIPQTEEDLKLLESLDGSVEAWTPVAGHGNTTIDLTIDPKYLGMVKSLLQCRGIQYSTTILDMQRAMDEENIESPSVPSFRGKCSTTGMTWTKYHSYNTISSYIDCLGNSYDGVRIHRIGHSSEGREIKVVEFGRGSKGVWIDGGIHAREWISPASVSYILRSLVEESHRFQDLLNTFTFYISPSINPDGYEYTRTSDRMWRKTRSRSSGSCVGVDPNRNWDYQWGGKGASHSPCSETYRGARAFSEPETRAVRDFILHSSRRNKWELYLTFHSYGQMILYPWGYDRKDHSIESELHRLGNVAARAMGRGYTVGSAAKVLYPASGGSDDWALGGAGIPYSYTIELPDTGTYGFLLPANNIYSVAEEALAATLAMVKDLQTRSSRG